MKTLDLNIVRKELNQLKEKYKSKCDISINEITFSFDININGEIFKISKFF